MGRKQPLPAMDMEEKAAGAAAHISEQVMGTA
jgi:hypothetical protein